MKTDTPRTDAKKFISRGTALYATLPKEVVMASFARILERELTAMTEQRDEARKDVIFWQSLAEGRARTDDETCTKILADSSNEYPFLTDEEKKERKTP